LFHAIFAIKKYNQYLKEKQENYFNERQALCIGILVEFKRNENLLKAIKDRGIIMINDLNCIEENFYQT